MKYKINYAIGGALQPTIDQIQPIIIPIQTPIQVRRIPISGYESHDLQVSTTQIGKDIEDFIFKKYDCQLSTMTIFDDMTIRSIQCDNIGTGNGKKLLKDALDYLETNAKLPSNIKLTASSNIMASRLPFDSDTEQQLSKAKLVDYYKNMGFIPIDDAQNNIYNQKMVAKTKDVMTRLTELVRGGGSIWNNSNGI
jgi:hypothetical protein